MSEQEWVDGIPYAGCECQVFWFNEWKLSIITAVGEENILFKNLVQPVGEFNIDKNKDLFRPLKTKEEAEREEAINNVCTDLGIMLGTSHDRIDAAIDSMLRLGYHNGPKVNELSDEEMEVFLKGRESLLSPLYKIEAAKWAIDYILDKEE